MEKLGNKRGRKFIGTAHTEGIVKQEEFEREIGKIEGIHFIKCAAEASTEKKNHLQFYIETDNQTSGIALSKKMNKQNRTFWNSPHIDYAKDPSKAITYPGNLNFKHSDGKEKGGEVFWVTEIGKPYKNDGQKNEQKGAWKAKLIEMKLAVDEGKTLSYLWDNFFIEMIQTNKAFREYLKDKLAEKLRQEEAANKEIAVEAYNPLKEEIRALKEVNSQLCAQLWKQKELYAELDDRLKEIEKMSTPF